MRRMYMVCIVVGCVLLAAALYAAYPGDAYAAGFAKQSLFLSQSKVTEGQTVFIYAVVEDSTPNAFVGTLHFSDESGPIKNVSVTLEPGKANTVSVPWKPKAGDHKITATLTSANNETVESQDATFTVDPVDPPRPLSQAEPFSTNNSAKSKKSDETVVWASTPVVDAIEKISPIAASKTLPAFNSVDSFRKDTVVKLDHGTDWSKTNIQQASKAPSSTQNTLWLILYTFALYFCSAFAYALANIGIFYPAIVVIFFFVLWRIFKTFSR